MGSTSQPNAKRIDARELLDLARESGVSTQEEFAAWFRHNLLAPEHSQVVQRNANAVAHGVWTHGEGEVDLRRVLHFTESPQSRPPSQRSSSEPPPIVARRPGPLGPGEAQLVQLDQASRSAFDSHGRFTKAGQRLIAVKFPLLRTHIAALLWTGMWSIWSLFWFKAWATPSPGADDFDVLAAASVLGWIAGLVILGRLYLSSVRDTLSKRDRYRRQFKLGARSPTLRRTPRCRRPERGIRQDGPQAEQPNSCSAASWLLPAQVTTSSLFSMTGNRSNAVTSLTAA